MAHIVLWVSTSLDGYIADAQGGVKWLDEINSFNDDYGYNDFLDTVDIIIMGKNSYTQLLTLGEWRYDDKQTFVFAEEPMSSENEAITFVSGSVDQFIDQLNETNPNSTIWLFGGANMIAQFEKANLIDQYIITKAPKALGDGIKLTVDEENLIQESEVKYPNGVIQTHYSN